MRSIFTAQHFADLYAEMRVADSPELPLLNKVMAQMAVINLARESGVVMFELDMPDKELQFCFSMDTLVYRAKKHTGTLYAHLQEPVPSITDDDGMIELGDFAPDGGLSHMTAMLLGESKYEPNVEEPNEDMEAVFDD